MTVESEIRTGTLVYDVYGSSSCWVGIVIIVHDFLCRVYWADGKCITYYKDELTRTYTFIN